MTTKTIKRINNIIQKADIGLVVLSSKLIRNNGLFFLKVGKNIIQKYKLKNMLFLQKKILLIKNIILKLFQEIMLEKILHGHQELGLV